jgi:hypothetical protein
VKAETGGTRHGDAAIAIALAYGSTRGQSGPLEYEGVGKNEPVNDDPDDDNAGHAGFYGRRRDAAY